MIPGFYKTTIYMPTCHKLDKLSSTHDSCLPAEERLSVQGQVPFLWQKWIEIKLLSRFCQDFNQLFLVPGVSIFKTD
jgi:hypothetical protein